MTVRGSDGDWQDEVRRVARGIRRRVLAHTVANSGGYLSQACSAAEILATLYIKSMNLAPVKTPILPGPFPGTPGPGNRRYTTGAAYNGEQGADFDRFILSPAQYALALYAALAEVGRLAPEGMQQFNQDGGIVEMIGAEHSPGMEVMTGSLGQGLSQAAGIAAARRLKGETGRVWVFMSDGEFQSGQNWEAVQAAAHHRLANLAVVVDVNGQQCDGEVGSVMTVEPLKKRLESFGARVCRLNGHNIEALAGAGSLRPQNRPLVILANTNPCQGLALLRARSPKLHYVRFGGEDERLAYREALKILEVPED
ncbi:MAG TPA: 1-deoxy-D-xylulose-5-phosphate synthase N-terminal domain-containing protein [Selenomonadales bacterium]|nr:1-deoxy-D-xylulose-5-phosphate synthase N-terminal domain-containing protein [Selenomonadales bacterium]